MNPQSPMRDNGNSQPRLIHKFDWTKIGIALAVAFVVCGTGANIAHCQRSEAIIQTAKAKESENYAEAKKVEVAAAERSKLRQEEVEKNRPCVDVVSQFGCVGQTSVSCGHPKHRLYVIGATAQCRCDGIIPTEK